MFLLLPTLCFSTNYDVTCSSAPHYPDVFFYLLRLIMLNILQSAITENQWCHLLLYMHVQFPLSEHSHHPLLYRFRPLIFHIVLLASSLQQN